MKTSVEHKRWTFTAVLVFFLSEIDPSVGVSRTPAQEEVLDGAVGNSLTFPTRVTRSGALMYEGCNIGQVVNKQTDIKDKFKNRLQWDSESGFFTLSDLTTNDSGVYTVQSMKEDNTIHNYSLKVYDKVSAPQVVKLISNPPGGELCSLLCSVRNVRGLNLSWFEGEVLLNYTSSSSPNNTLSLPLEMWKSDKDIFSCVASNPVSKQTTTVNITEYCPQEPGGKPDYRPHSIGVGLLVCVALVIMVVTLASRQHRADSPETEELQV